MLAPVEICMFLFSDVAAALSVNQWIEGCDMLRPCCCILAL